MGIVFLEGGDLNNLYFIKFFLSSTHWYQEEVKKNGRKKGNLVLSILFNWSCKSSIEFDLEPN